MSSETDGFSVTIAECGQRLSIDVTSYCIVFCCINCIISIYVDYLSEELVGCQTSGISKTCRRWSRLVLINGTSMRSVTTGAVRCRDCARTDVTSKLNSSTTGQSSDESDRAPEIGRDCFDLFNIRYHHSLTRVWATVSALTCLVCSVLLLQCSIL